MRKLTLKWTVSQLSTNIDAWAIMCSFSLMWTNLIFAGCFGSSKITGNGSHLTCQFKGVYPSASVLWFQNNTITANSTIQKTAGGLYDYSSSISLDEGNRDQPYSCVLSRSSPCPDVKLEGNRGAIKLQRNTFVIEMTMMMMTFMW